MNRGSVYDELTVENVCVGDVGRDTDVTLSCSMIPLVGEVLWFGEVFLTRHTGKGTCIYWKYVVETKLSKLTNVED